MSHGLKAPNLQAAMNQAQVNIGGMVESIYSPLYDYLDLPAAGANKSLTFFQTPVGQGGKTLVDTNMSMTGSLPKGQNFLITGVQVEFIPGVETSDATIREYLNDVQTFYKSGALILTIGSKEFIRQGNLMKFPPVNRLDGFASTGLTAESTQYATAAGREFQVVDMLVPSNQNFNVQLIGLPVLPSGADGRVGVTLNGYLFRNAQ